MKLVSNQSAAAPSLASSTNVSSSQYSGASNFASGAAASVSGNVGNLTMTEMKMNVRQTLNKSRLSPAVAGG